MCESSSEKILQAKNSLDSQLATFLVEYPENKGDKAIVQKLVTNLITEHSKVLSTINIAIGKIHQEIDFFSSDDLQSDYLITIENFLHTSFQVKDIINKVIIAHNLTKFSFSEKSYETMQRFINTFASKEIKESIKRDFIKNKIATKGFNKKFKRMKSKYLRTQLFVGIPSIGFEYIFNIHGRILAWEILQWNSVDYIESINIIINFDCWFLFN